MRRLAMVLFAGAVLTACATPRSTQARYEAAVVARMEGDSEIYFRELLDLARDAPDTRAGRRARAILAAGGLMGTLASWGTVAALTLPTLQRTRGRARVDHVSGNLTALASAVEATRNSDGPPCATFQECRWQPEAGDPYLYLLDLGEMAGGDAAPDPSLLRLQAIAALGELGVAPRIDAQGYLIAAVGDPDRDGAMDVWVVDQDGTVVHVLAD